MAQWKGEEGNEWLWVWMNVMRGWIAGVADTAALENLEEDLASGFHSSDCDVGFSPDKSWNNG